MTALNALHKICFRTASNIVSYHIRGSKLLVMIYRPIVHRPSIRRYYILISGEPTDNLRDSGSLAVKTDHIKETLPILYYLYSVHMSS